MLEQVQDLENEGYQFEAAEASFELLLRKEIGRYQQVLRPGPLPRGGAEAADAGEPVSEATVKLRVNGADRAPRRRGRRPGQRAGRRAAPGAAAALPGDRPGPPDRLQGAGDQLQGRDGRQGARGHRVPPGRAADGTKEMFGTIGVSANIIDASWQALVDAYEYHLIQAEEAEG